MNPAKNASVAPATVTSEPALLANADRLATPSAAPISRPVIKNPEATPAWEAGMPATEVNETGTNIMPIPRPSADRPGRMSLAKWASLPSVDNHTEEATVISSPMVARACRERWAPSVATPAP
jgi:hypothetical protein